MAGFDESALKRLEELVSKSKAGPKLPPAEALELKELKLLKSAAEIAKSRAEIEVSKHKMKDREKYGSVALTQYVGKMPCQLLRIKLADRRAGSQSALRLPHLDRA